MPIAFFCIFVYYLYYWVTTIERLDQGPLYPLGERRDKHVTGGARTSAPMYRRRTLYLKSYLDSLYAAYLEPLLGLSSTTTAGPLHRRPSACVHAA